LPDLDRQLLNSIGTVGGFVIIAFYVWSRRFPARVLFIGDIMAALVLIVAALRFFIYLWPILPVDDASTVNAFAPWLGLAVLLGMLAAQRRYRA